MKKVVFATPSLSGLTAPYVSSLAASVPLVEAAGWDHGLVQEIGSPYISAARNTMLRKAMDARADVVVFIDYDLSWAPEDMVTLLDTPGDVVAGTYRFKKDEEEYMGAVNTDADGHPLLRANGCIYAHRIPAGFLKVTKEAVNRFMEAYPDLVYGPRYSPSVDLFNHGAHKGVWYGEDYAFSRNWIDCGGEIMIVPKLNITHHSATQSYPGNFHNYLCRQPGGSHAEAA